MFVNKYDKNLVYSLRENDMTQKLTILITMCSLLLSSCAASIFAEPTAAPTAAFTPQPPTATFTLEPSPTFTPEPPTATPTIAVTLQPMSATMKTATNVRSLPSKGKGDRIGGVYANSSVKVFARDETASWLWIEFTESPMGKGWVTAAAVKLDVDMGILPIAIYEKNAIEPILLPPLLHTVTGTPLPINPPVEGSVTGSANQILNVRVGPSLGFVVIGMIQPGVQVTITGQTGNKWYQIEYPSGIDGKAWISGSILKIDGKVKSLPMFNVMGTPESAEKDRAKVDAAMTGTALAVSGGDQSTPQPTAAEEPATITPTPRGPIGSITAQINVRSGPASSFQSYGLIDPKTNVIITARTLNGLWLMIEYSASPTGYGWVAAEYVKFLSDISGLPYYDNSGTPMP
jgi:uncharacterized protein YgiM (DUF1202 family)